MAADSNGSAGFLGAPPASQITKAADTRANLWLAYQRVLGNTGAAGVVGVTVAEFRDGLVVHWSSVKKALLEGRDLPRPVRRADIPKPSGGVRTLGIQTLVDRLIQQALHQVLSRRFAPTF